MKAENWSAFLKSEQKQSLTIKLTESKLKLNYLKIFSKPKLALQTV